LTSNIRSETSTTRVDPDYELVARAKQELPNRTEAYEALLRRYESLLFRVCRRVMGNDADAEDAFQETMVKVFHGLLKFEGRSLFKTWLFTIAHNTCYTALKRIAKAQEYKRYAENLSDEEPKHTPSELGLDAEKVLQALNPEDRELLALRYIGEFTFDEIAEICGVGRSAVKMRIYRATDFIRNKHKP